MSLLREADDDPAADVVDDDRLRPEAQTAHGRLEDPARYVSDAECVSQLAHVLEPDRAAPLLERVQDALARLLGDLLARLALLGACHDSS